MIFTAIDFGPRYRFVRRLGEGGFGLVVEVFDHERGENVALKSFTRPDATELVRFKSEFRAFAEFAHPNLVRLYELGSFEGRWYFTMERVAGTEWLDYVAPLVQIEAATGPVDDDVGLDVTQRSTEFTGSHSGESVGRPARTCDIGRVRRTLPGIVAGLRYLHSHDIVHCDIKPSNVLVTPEGRVVILDFGIATQAGVRMSGVTEQANIVGTPLYMAPEQVESRTTTAATDAYALGTMLFEALTEGRFPFEGSYLMSLVRKCTEAPPRVASLKPDVPPDLAALAEGWLVTRAEERRPLDNPMDADAAPKEVAARTSAALEFAGRSRELAFLRDAFARSDRGPVMTHVQGASGSGKSTLVERALSELGGGAIVLRGRCFAREQVPYKAFDMLVDDLARALRRIPPTRRAHVVPRQAAALVRTFPVLARVPEFADAPARFLTDDDRPLAFAALRELLARMAELAPLVLVFDDLQWGDADSAKLLAHLLAPPDAPRATFVLVSRGSAECTDFLEEFESRRQALAVTVAVEPLHLDRLDEEDAERLALEWLRATGKDVSKATAIARASGGLPIFVRELVQAATPGETPSGTDALSTLEIDDLIRARLATQPEPVRAMVELVAIANRGLSASDLLALTGLDVSTLSRVLPDLCREHVLRVEGGSRERFRTFHDRVREAVTAGMDIASLRQAHVRLARHFATVPGVDADWVFGHARDAGMHDLAGEWALRAARTASAALAHERAAATYEEALRLLPVDDDRRLGAMRQWAESLERAHRSRRAAEAYLAVAKHPNVPAEEAAWVRVRAGEQLVSLGEDEQGIQIVSPVAKALGVPLPRNRWNIVLHYLGLRLWLALFGGRNPQQGSPTARDLLRRDVAILIAFSVFLVDMPLSFLLTGWISRHGYRVGDPVSATTWLMLYGFGDYLNGWMSTQRALKQFDEAEKQLDDSRVGETLRVQYDVARATITLTSGRAQEAAATFDALLAGPARRGHASSFKLAACYSLASLGWAGRYAELVRRAEEYRGWAAERDDLLLSAMLGGGEGCLAWIVQDAVDLGRPFVRRSLSAWRPGAVETDLPRIYGEWSLALFDAYEGDGEAAYARIDACLATFATNPFVAPKTIRCLTEIFRARYALQAWAQAPHRVDLARRCRRAIRWASFGCFATYRPILTFLRAGVAEIEGQGNESAALLREAVGGCARLGLRGHERLGRHEWAVATGDDASASGVLAELRREEVVQPAKFIAVHMPGLATARAFYLERHMATTEGHGSPNGT